MNRIPEATYHAAFDLFWDGASVREVSHQLGIAKKTAHSIQKEARVSSFYFEGHWLRRVGKSKAGRRQFRLEIAPDTPLEWTKNKKKKT